MDRPVKQDSKCDADCVDIARPREACVLLQVIEVDRKFRIHAFSTAGSKAITTPGLRDPVVIHLVPAEQPIVGVVKPEWPFQLHASSVTVRIPRLAEALFKLVHIVQNQPLDWNADHAVDRQPVLARVNARIVLRGNELVDR